MSQYHPAGGPGEEAAETNGLAIASLFLGIIWLFGIVDGLTEPFSERLLGRRVPGLGLVTTAVGVVLVGALATNVIGKRLLQRGESYLLRVPVFRTIYAPVKQLVVAFSPPINSFS